MGFERWKIKKIDALILAASAVEMKLYSVIID